MTPENSGSDNSYFPKICVVCKELASVQNQLLTV